LVGVVTGVFCAASNGGYAMKKQLKLKLHFHEKKDIKTDKLFSPVSEVSRYGWTDTDLGFAFFISKFNSTKFQFTHYRSVSGKYLHDCMFGLTSET
jgi:hypothetical protein